MSLIQGMKCVFSCRLVFFLPLNDLQGEVSGLAVTDVFQYPSTLEKIPFFSTIFFL